MGTGYRPEKKIWVPMSTGYRPGKNFWVPMGTGQEKNLGTDGYRVPGKFSLMPTPVFKLKFQLKFIYVYSVN